VETSNSQVALNLSVERNKTNIARNLWIYDLRINYENFVYYKILETEIIGKKKNSKKVSKNVY